MFTSLRYHQQQVALITVSGEPGSRHEEVARLAANRLRFELITTSWLADRVRDEVPNVALPVEAWPHVATSILARVATEQHLLICADGAEHLFPTHRDVLRVRVSAPESFRVGALMVDHGIDRSAAKQLMRELDGAPRTRSAKAFDLVLNAERLTTDQMGEALAAAIEALGLKVSSYLPFAVEAQMQFNARLNLAGHGIAPLGVVKLGRRDFSHPSEEIFANLLDFYRIAWEYEPRSFALETAPDGRVVEAFTPDFYLPEFDTYIELTTMKQALVTKKNRKVRRLKELYPSIRIQVFYQRDFDNLVFKHGLATRAADDVPMTA